MISMDDQGFDSMALKIDIPLIFSSGCNHEISSHHITIAYM